MSTPAPLIVTGPARSGTTLVALLLSAHRDVMVATDPYLVLFRSLRNAIVRAQPGGLLPGFDPASPLQDYYFTKERLAVLDSIEQSDLSVPFDPAEWDAFLERSTSRGAVMAPDLAARFTELRGRDYREIFDRAFRLVAAVRDVPGRRWVGFKDVWIIEFFGAIARAFTDARFVVVLRDPRAIAASMMAIDDPAQVAHPLSYARHWRKHVAFIEHYRQDPLFANRLHVLTLEDLVVDPETQVRGLCTFLDVPFDPGMLDARNYLDYATGSAWTGNSSFERRTSGFNRSLAEQWRGRLDPRIKRLTEFVCGPDMELAGLTPDSMPGVEDSAVLEYLLASNDQPVNWRSDLGDSQQDYGFEVFRRALLARPHRSPAPASDLIRRSFLFPEVFTAMRQRQTRAAHV